MSLGISFGTTSCYIAVTRNSNIMKSINENNEVSRDILQYRNEKGVSDDQIQFTKDNISKIIKKVYEEGLKKTNKTNQIEDVWLSIPSTFTQDQQAILQEAAKAVITKHAVHFVPEPISISHVYGRTHIPSNENIVVYDLGRSSFRVSVIHMKDQNHYKILNHFSDSSIGGNSFDDRLSQLIEEKFEKNNRGMPLLEEDNVTSKRLLRNEMEKLKIKLSSNNQITFQISKFYEELNKIHQNELDDSYSDLSTIGLCYDDITVTREEFNDLNQDLILTTIDKTKQCIRNCNIQEDDISCVLLVGGSTHIPLVQERLKQEFNNKVQIYPNREECAACGAALMGIVNKQSNIGLCTSKNNIENKPPNLDVSSKWELIKFIKDKFVNREFKICKKVIYLICLICLIMIPFMRFPAVVAQDNYIEASQCDLVRALDKSATELIIPEGSCNDAERLDLSGFNQLTKIVVHNNAFMNCKKIVLKGEMC